MSVRCLPFACAAPERTQAHAHSRPARSPQPSSSLFILQSATPSQRIECIGHLSTGSLYLIPVWPRQKWTGENEADSCVTDSPRETRHSAAHGPGGSETPTCNPSWTLGLSSPICMERKAAQECSRMLQKAPASRAAPGRLEQPPRERGEREGGRCGGRYYFGSSPALHAGQSSGQKTTSSSIPEPLLRTLGLCASQASKQRNF